MSFLSGKYSQSWHENTRGPRRSKKDASSRSEPQSSFRHSTDGRSNTERRRQDGISGKTIAKTLNQILQVVATLESKMDALGRKVDRLLPISRDNSSDSAYAIVTGSHITPKRDEQLPISSNFAMFSESDSSCDEHDNDNDIIDIIDDSRSSYPMSEFGVYHVSEYLTHNEPLGDLFETEQIESIRRKKPDKQDTNNKETEAESGIKSTNQHPVDNHSVNEGEKNTSSANNDKQTTNTDTKGTSTLNLSTDGVNSSEQSLGASPRTSDKMMIPSRINTTKTSNIDEDLLNDESVVLPKDDDGEKAHDNENSSQTGKTPSLVVNGSEFQLGTFPKQPTDKELPDELEKQSESNNDIQPQRSNNQQMNESGLKNEQGDSDNRFNPEAHEMIPLLSVRSTNLSNSRWIKSGIWKTDVTNQKHQLRELLEQQTRASRASTDMRSTGIDTIICLDTSASMDGLPLENAKSVINDLIKGFEHNAIEHDLEENVSVVVFGKQTKILNHLTNDYNVVLDELFQITAGGPSPLWVGLALALTEIKERGNIVTVGESNILPRIILITDGYATPKYVLHGDDGKDVKVTEETKQEIINFRETCRQFSRTIDCIQVGQCEQTVLHELSGGRLFTREDVDYLTQFFRVQDTADELTMKIGSGEFQQEDVDKVLSNSDLTQKAQEDVRELIKDVKFTKEKVEQRVDDMVLDEKRPDPPGIEQSAESEEITNKPDPGNNKSTEQQSLTLQDESEEPETVVIDDVTDPVFGASVAPNESWTGFESKQYLTGTVMGPRKKGMVKIVWSDGTIDRCHYGINGKYDFKIVPDLFDSAGIHVGAIVERGPDWRWKDQDGGPGSIGVVTKLDEGVAHVTWSHSGVGNYRYGYKKKYDVKLCESRQKQRDQGSANQPKDHLTTPAIWQIQTKDGNWLSLEREAAQSIEHMYSCNKAAQFVVQVNQVSLRVSIDKLEATDLNTRQTYPIRRLELSFVIPHVIVNEQQLWIEIGIKRRRFTQTI